MGISVNKHNVDVDVLCDWIEGSALFDSKISKSDAVDQLLDNQVYNKQDFAYDIISTAWAELRRRQAWLGQSTHIVVEGKTVERSTLTWRQAPGSAFCLALALSRFYAAWDIREAGSYNMQGNIFELLVGESMKTHGWRVHRTGWSAEMPPNAFGDVVRSVADELREPFVNPAIIKMYQDQGQHEMGLDYVCTRQFLDKTERCGMPAYFVQCASGQNWVGKLKTPDIQRWSQVIQFASLPKKAFATPMAFHDDEVFWRHTTEIEGLLLDRNRLLSARTMQDDWLSQDLKTQLIDWLTPRVASVPRQ